MALILDAACLCDTGRVRKNNEDNFYFDGRCLPADNDGLTAPLTWHGGLWGRKFFAVFDGIGGENCGEEASCAAAEWMRENPIRLTDAFTPAEELFRRLCVQLNAAVLARAGTLMVERMGSTMAALCFTRRGVTACNIGDSRVYILRDGALRQLSVDHVEHWEGRKKTPLTQHLGLDPEELRLEPSICEEALRGGDRFLLCSDGLSDMLEDERIAELLAAAPGAEQAARSLLDAALEQGGRDNTTVIVCCLTDAAK